MGTMGMMSESMGGYNENIFAQQAQMDMMNQAPDREKPRANLYNVIKRLRENNVSRIDATATSVTYEVFFSHTERL